MVNYSQRDLRPSNFSLLNMANRKSDYNNSRVNSNKKDNGILSVDKCVIKTRDLDSDFEDVKIKKSGTKLGLYNKRFRR